MVKAGPIRPVLAPDMAAPLSYLNITDQPLGDRFPFTLERSLEMVNVLKKIQAMATVLAVWLTLWECVPVWVVEMVLSLL